MKRTIIATALACAAGLSLGGRAHANPPQAHATSAAAAAASAKSNAQAEAVGINLNSVTGYTSGYAVGNANSAYGVGGNATAVSGQGGTAYGGSGGTVFSMPYQGVTVNTGNPAQQTITHNGRSQVETVPNVYSPNVYPTSPCMGSSSVGASWLGFGMSGGTSWEAIECEIQEASRNAPTPADRIFVWCKGKFAAGSPSCVGQPKQADATTGSVPVAADRKFVTTTERVAPGAEVWQ